MDWKEYGGRLLTIISHHGAMIMMLDRHVGTYSTEYSSTTPAMDADRNSLRRINANGGQCGMKRT